MPNTSSISDFLLLLRCALWNSRPQLDLMDDWNAVVRMAQQQTTLGLVGHSALQCDAALQLLPESRLRLQQQVDQLADRAKHCEALISRMVPALEAEGIEVWLLKGQGLAAFYPAPLLRHCGDVDLLVRPACFDKAVSVLNRLATPQAVAEAFNTDKHYHIRIDGFDVELHRRCMAFADATADQRYQSLEDEAIALPPDDFKLNGTAIHRLEPTFNAFYVFLHLWEHFLERGIGLRQVCDFTLLIHARNAQIDRTRLRPMLEAFGLMRPWQLFGALAVNHLGLPEEEMPFFDPRFVRKARRLLRVIFKEGNFGRSTTLRQQHTRRRGLSRRLTTLLSIQVRSWRIFTLLPDVGLHLWKQKMKGGLNK